MTTEVDRDDAKPVCQLVGQQLIHRTAESSGVGNEQHLAAATELVGGDLRSIVARDCPGGVHWLISTSDHGNSANGAGMYRDFQAREGATMSAEQTISFAADPQTYRHWRVALDGAVATVTMAVAPDAGLRD